MNIGETRFVRFDIFCKYCKYKSSSEFDSPCYECLSNPVVEHSKVPINYVGATRKPITDILKEAASTEMDDRWKRQIEELLKLKVDKVEGKQLSDENFTAEMKSSLTEDIPYKLNDLQGQINNIDIPEVLNDLDDVEISEPQDGQIMSYSKEDNKFHNIDMPETGGGSLLKDVTTNISVGAIATGTTLEEGTTFTEFVEKLGISEIAPSVTFSISKSGNVMYGDSYTEILMINVTSMGTAGKIDSVSWYKNDSLIQTDIIDSETTGSWSHTMSEETKDNTTFKAIISYFKSDGSKATITKEAAIRFYYPRYYGSIDTLEPTETSVKLLPNGICTGRAFSQTFTLNDARAIVAYPKSYGDFANIKDGNGFDITDAFTKSEAVYTQNYTPVPYRLYILTEPATVTDYTIKFE